MNAHGANDYAEILGDRIRGMAFENLRNTLRQLESVADFFRQAGLAIAEMPRR